MKYRIESTGIDTKHSEVLKLALSEGESFKARASSVMSYGGDIETKTETTRSLWKAVTTFENYPLTRIMAKKGRNGGVVTISPPLPGAIEAVQPSDKKMKVQSLGFVGVPSKYSVNLKRKEIYSNNKSLALLDIEKVNNSSLDRVFIGGFHGITKVELGEDERTHVSKDYLLAMDSTVSYSKESSSIKESTLAQKSSPNLDIKGPGSVYLHARSPFKFERIMDKIEEG